ncbi:hypothetical protein [Cryobacterium fucosi]|uniref:Uncharacterized protein n=1 Tax=Cryobacterium fucosi TaxID=1259157 RepID=A0A4R9BIR4_9MICO|nr:hypothetical protein [Cryobacterium fucosi]TFD83958.1 hypothetical protein E3T48_00065 [Cryobacterium fucosi]
MSDTKLRAKLPEGDANGLKGEVWRKRLVEQPLRPRVAIVIFDAPTGAVDHETGMEIPSVRVLAVEPVLDPITEQMLVSLLTDMSSARTGAATLDIDFPAPTPEPDMWTGPLQLEQRGVYTFIVRALPGARFGLYLVTDTGAEVGKRGALKPAEHGGVEPGSYVLELLPESLQRIAHVLVGEWEANVVEAEVVDEAPDAPEFDEDDAGDFEPGDAADFDFDGGES